MTKKTKVERLTEELEAAEKQRERVAVILYVSSLIAILCFSISFMTYAHGAPVGAFNVLPAIGAGALIGSVSLAVYFINCANRVITKTILLELAKTNRSPSRAP